MKPGALWSRSLLGKFDHAAALSKPVSPPVLSASSFSRNACGRTALRWKGEQGGRRFPLNASLCSSGTSTSTVRSLMASQQHANGASAPSKKSIWLTQPIGLKFRTASRSPIPPAWYVGSIQTQSAPKERASDALGSLMASQQSIMLEVLGASSPHINDLNHVQGLNYWKVIPTDGPKSSDATVLLKADTLPNQRTPYTQLFDQLPDLSSDLDGLVQASASFNVSLEAVDEAIQECKRRGTPEYDQLIPKLEHYKQLVEQDQSVRAASRQTPPCTPTTFNKISGSLSKKIAQLFLQAS